MGVQRSTDAPFFLLFRQTNTSIILFSIDDKFFY